MTNTTENAQRLYLNSWNYNAADILTELETIVKNNGGQICRTWTGATTPGWMKERKQLLITNRTLSGAIREKQDLLERLEARGRTEAARNVRKTLEEYEAINNEPKLSFYGDYLYISFVLDGYYYYFSMDKNPFFDFIFAKMKTENGERMNKYYYMQTDSKSWWDDCFWRFDCSEADKREAAYLIFNMLLTARTCNTYKNNDARPYTNIVYLEG